MKNLSLCLALGTAVMVGGQAVQAAPIAPSQSNIQSLWQFDDTVGTQGTAGYGTPDSKGGPTLQAGRTNYGIDYLSGGSQTIPLVGAGDSVAVNGGGTTTNFSSTPFNYAGNKSVLVDWYGPITGQENYPQDRTGLGVTLSSPSYNIGAEGAVSFWYNPVYHAQAEPAESYLFAIRGAGSTERLVAGIFRNSAGDPVNGFVTNASGTGGVQVADWGIDYSGLANGSPSLDWYNIVVTWGADGLFAYSNGNLVGSDSAFIVNSFDANRIFLGTYTTGGSQAPGLYDDFTIWNTSLSADNAQWLAHNNINSLNGTPAVPEPATAALGLMGLFGLAAASRRRRNA